MCGISGYIANKNLVKKGSIETTLQLMQRRGPDFSDYYTEDLGQNELAMLHSRLSIIDLRQRSNQPYKSDHYIIIFNGEIYNFNEIKKNLEKKNYFFKTNSDTEVLLKAYQEYGENCVNYFVGMWAFAIWNSKTKKLFLSRDPFGEKPLYYFLSARSFFFGSEIKFIKSLVKKNFSINKELIYQNIFSGYKSLHKTNKTFYHNILSLNSGCNLLIDLNFKTKIKKFWKPELKVNSKLKYDEILHGVKERLLKSLNYRMVADVPIAFCLSGGIDSGVLVSLAKKKLKKKISTFSIIDSDERYNEFNDIKKISNNLNLDMNLIHLKKNKNSFFRNIFDLVNYHDGPIATISYYIHSFLSKKISDKGFKISISGTGADEIFTGYYDHYLHFFETIKNDKSNLINEIEHWKLHISPFIRNEGLKNPYRYIDDKNNRELIFEKNFDNLKYSNKGYTTKFKEVNFCSESLRNRMMNEMFYEVVPVILKHDDLNCMYNSIENRSPYLDRELYEYCLTIPPKFLISQGYQKKILRDISKDFLIDDIRLNRKKRGFNASINSILDLKDKETQNFIFDHKSPINEFIDLKKLKRDINFHQIPNHLSKLIFNVICTKIFLEKNN